MSICWYCHWGWPKAVADIYRRYRDEVGEMAMDFGPAHIVWSDENFGDESVKFCIDNAQKYRGELTDDELGLVMHSLNELLLVPENVRCCEPEEYDGINPESFPPPANIVMSKKRDY
jgi:hypothetical protein